MMAIAGVASATTIVMPTDAQLVEKSPVIVRGVVLSSAPVDRSGAIWTETILQVEANLKGPTGATVTIREVGGIVGNRITKIFGAPDYVKGEHVLAFLTPTPRGDYQTMDLFVGKFTEAKTLSGQRLWQRNNESENVALLDANFRRIESSNIQRDAKRFELFIVDRAGGRKAAQSYGVENPILAPGAGRLQVAPNFTLISEPTIYRWFAFENGGAAAWYSSGTQPGYMGGGVTEVNAGMAAWTTYTAALIRYSFAGPMSGSPAGLARPNGTNEILFNDPLNEIAGTWDPSKGGVVGQGGFNGVSSTLNWSSPFTADTAHPQQLYRAWNIVEGNLVIQDNVSPSQSIRSATLAEILAHELGHTLGFGHSTDNTALMFASVTGLGPSLRPDDQLAARWLYPNGIGSGPPAQPAPNAPSNLTATATSGSSVALQWTDNSTNENGFHVYYASGAGGGSFTNVGNLAAGSTGAMVTGVTAGTYRFYVTAYNASGESAPSNTAVATISSQQQPPLAAAFTVAPGTTGVAGQTTFTVTDQSTGAVASRTWNFGDGAISTAAIAPHLYNAAGTYTITLTVRDSAGMQSVATRSISVTAASQSLTAAFVYSPASPLAGDSVTFSDRSDGGVTSWAWNFGDGSASSQQNPAKTFAAAGSYNVTLTIYRNAESRVTQQTVSVGVKSPVTPQPVQFQSLVPVTAQTNGIGGSIWRTELSIFNAGDETASIALTFVPGAGVAAQTQSIAVQPRETRTYENTLLEVFGMSSGAGGISITATSATTTPDLNVMSRTFAATPAGTYGQAVPGVAPSDLQNTLYMTGLISTAGFRTNIGLVNKSSSGVSATMTLVDADGGIVENSTLSIPPNSFQQGSLAGYFPSTSGRELSLLSLRVGTSSRDALSAYASIVDNKTSDPVYVQAMPLVSTGPITIPVVARANGANGTFWRSDVTLYNPNSSYTDLTLTFRSANGMRTRSVTVGPNSSIVIADVVTTLGDSSASGPLQVAWSGSNSPVVTSRTYTTAPGGGTFGQSVDPIAGFSRQQYVTGLRSNVDFRTNVGFVNGGADAITIHATVLSSSGAQIGTTELTIPAHAQVQYPLTALVQGYHQFSIGSCTVQAKSLGAATLFVYGSVVDNNTGDPVFFAGR